MGKDRGFTIVELVIVVTIIGILAAIAYPSYQAQVYASHRADAQGSLMIAANSMERYFTQNGTYVGAAAGTTFPAQSPFDGSVAYYALSITAPPTGYTTATGYTLKAIPVGPQASDPCGAMTIDNTGTHTTAGQSYCWQ